MKILMILALALPFLSSGQQTILVEASGFENNKGICLACLFNTKESFNSSKPLACVRASISDLKSNFTFSQVPEGNYAIALFHDANSNGKMDKNFLGIPKEGYGASKNRLPFASAPGFEENKFEVRKDPVSLRIRLRYL